VIIDTAKNRIPPPAEMHSFSAGGFAFIFNKRIFVRKDMLSNSENQVID